MYNMVGNQFGIKIRRCCASCAHKKNDARFRICMKGEGIVHPSDACDKWEMSKGMMNVGLGGGRVKTQEYIAYAAGFLLERKKTISEVRSEYMKANGDIYEKL